MNAMQVMKGEIELTSAILEAVARAAKWGLTADQIKAILDHASEAIEEHGVE